MDFKGKNPKHNFLQKGSKINGLTLHTYDVSKNISLTVNDERRKDQMPTKLPTLLLCATAVT
jgi:hypothetical protein